MVFKKPKTDKEAEALVDTIAEFFLDPLGYVIYAYPWGEAGTILANETGPDAWQTGVLKDIKSGVIDIGKAVQIAVSSGHGVGKSALLTWIIQWFISTRADPQIVVTANTETQLLTKTWREMRKWHKLMINSSWFEWTATRFYHKTNPGTWAANAIAWSEHNAEAFAGTHERDVLVIFDEASAIPDIIWENAEGAMTTPGAIWLVFGNPTKNTGRFRECFGRFRHRWVCRTVDSRTAKKADHKKIGQWVQDYGEDSDFVRVRVRGVFPRGGADQFIDSETVERCRQYVAYGYERMPRLLGVDVARFGDDETVLRWRQGRKVEAARCFRGKDLMQTASFVAEEMAKYPNSLAFVDSVGMGGGVIDRLHQLGYGDRVIEVNAGSKPNDEEKYANKRSEMWDLMREYLKMGAELPDEPDLFQQLCEPQYGFTGKQQLMLEKKDDMKKRGLASPDRADALALTFCYGAVVVTDPKPLEMPVLGCV